MIVTASFRKGCHEVSMQFPHQVFQHHFLVLSCFDRVIFKGICPSAACVLREIRRCRIGDASRGLLKFVAPQWSQRWSIMPRHSPRSIAGFTSIVRQDRQRCLAEEQLAMSPAAEGLIGIFASRKLPTFKLHTAKTGLASSRRGCRNASCTTISSIASWGSSTSACRPWSRHADSLPVYANGHHYVRGN